MSTVETGVNMRDYEVKLIMDYIKGLIQEKENGK